MTRARKTFKDLKENKERARALHEGREGERKEKGGMRNLKREAEEEAEAWGDVTTAPAWTLEELKELVADLEKEPPLA